MKYELIRALWWKQPYASMMLIGKIETRTWETNVRGKVLICSSKLPYWPQEAAQISGGLHFSAISKLRKSNYKLFDTLQLNGYAIAIGDLVDCRPMTIEDEEKTYVKYREGLWCHIYENVLPIKPFEIKGSQGWRILTDEQKKQIILI